MCFDGGMEKSGFTIGEPNKALKPLLNKIGRTAMNEFDIRNGSDPYKGPRVAGLGQMTQQGLNALGGAANNSAQMSRGMLKNLNAMAGGQQPQGMNRVQSYLQQVASGQNAIDTGRAYGQLQNNYANAGQNINQLGNKAGQYSTAGDFNQLGNQIDRGAYSGVGDWRDLSRDAGDPMVAERYLDDMARGRLVGANPYVNEMARIASDRAKEAVQAAAGGTGRYGSRSFMGQVGQKVAEAENAMRMQAYNDDSARQLQAAGLISGEQQAGFNQQLATTQGMAGARTQDLSGMLSALQGEQGARQAEFGNKLSAKQSALQALAGQQAAIAGKTGVQGANITNQANTAGQLGQLLNQQQQMQLGAMGMFPALNKEQFYGAQQQIAGGQLTQAQQQAQYDAARQLFLEQQNAPWTEIGRLQAAMQSGQPYAQQTQFQQAPSPFSQILGAGAGMAGMAGSLFGYGGPFGQGGYYGAPR